MNKFILNLTDDTEDSQVIFDLFDDEISNKWACEINKNYELFENDRFTNWPNVDNSNKFIETLKKQVDIINTQFPNLINEVITDTIDQEILNKLHKFFEELRGPIDTGSRFYNACPEHIQAAICKFNITIHEFEHHLFNQEAIKITNHPYATIVGTFKNRPRYNLVDTDYDHFTFKWDFGTVYINYCEVGKPLLDVFKDQDDIVGIDNIRPLHYYSADFQIKFGPATTEEIYQYRLKMFWEWFESKKEFLKFQKSKFLSLGLIPVAKINLEESNLKNLTQLEIIEKLSKYQKIKSVCIK
jgi:hypothetical protein